MRFLSMTLLLLASCGHACADAPVPARAKQATRCGVLLLTLAERDRTPSQESKRIYETVPGSLFARSADLGGTRAMQEAWIAQMQMQSRASTQAQRKRQLEVEWPQCLALIRQEALPLPRLDLLGKPY